MKLNQKAQLCYVSPHSRNNQFWLWFVDDLSEARGDDWSDGYWEDNASEPLNEDVFAVPVNLDVAGSSHWFGMPPDTYSVDMINGGGHAWLYTEVNGVDISFRAGMTLAEITKIIINMGGKIYLPSDKTPIKLPLTKKEFTEKIVEYFRDFINVSSDLLPETDFPRDLEFGEDVASKLNNLEKLRNEASEYWHKNYKFQWDLT